MSSCLKTRNQKRNLKSKTISSFLENDISNQEFDSYYQKCQRQKKLRFQDKKGSLEDSDTNSSGYSSSSTPSPSPSLSSYEDNEYNFSHVMCGYLDYESDKGITKDSGNQNQYSINFDATYSRVWYENNDNDESEENSYLTNEEIDRAIYEAEKWADF